MPVRLAGLTPGDAARLAQWKIVTRMRHLLDRGGLARARRRADRWAREALGAYSSFGAWVRRAGGGSLWLSPDEAASWAAAGWTAHDQDIAATVLGGRARLLGTDHSLSGVSRWRTDLYSGTEWPLERSSRMHIVRSDGSDIRTVWEWSRCYHFVPLARCYWAERDPRYARQVASDILSWASENPPGYGPNWASPMDVGIRAANWALAAVLLADAPEITGDVWQVVLRELRVAASFVERHLEWHPRYRGNHYLANIVALVYVGALLRDTPEGARWLANGADLLEEEMDYQVGPDGVALEGSLAYHRLDTELLAYGGLVVSHNCHARPTQRYLERLRRMYEFIAAYVPPSGDAPMLGDADDGRLHATSAEGWLEPRRHQLGLPPGYWPASAGSFAAPQGGFYVLRRGNDHCIVRAGAVALHGAGSHDHNDQLSFELVLGGRRIVADSGTYAYTRDLSARYAFRSTAAHSVPQLDGEEQNPIAADRPWRVLADRTRTRCLVWEASGETLRLVGEYSCAGGKAVFRREFRSDRESHWDIVDQLIGTGHKQLVWRLHFASLEARLEEQSGGWLVRLAEHPGMIVVVEAPPGFRGTLEIGNRSDRYGAVTKRASLVLRGQASLPATLRTTFRMEDLV